MIENESSAPQLLAALMAGGLAILLYGVEIGINDAALAQPLQAVGGGIIVAGILGLAFYLEQLPDKHAGH
ncbi:hypothetical protein [Halolamina sp.]|jgi:CBS-domain-containing membrane protein|uniref:hypothetical protein n=1 Tax=Halolamina sp. TaxID=1940283 RepID=UPI000223B9C0|nr:hypothetical protein Halar_3526 [halophilic archaeon DL31]